MDNFLNTSHNNQTLSLREVAEQAGVSTTTVRRWIEGGVIPNYHGQLTTEHASYARIIAQLRTRGHSLPDIRAAVKSGRLAFGYTEELFAGDDVTFSLKQAADQTGLEEALIRRFYAAMGFNSDELERIVPEDVDLLRRTATVLGSGFPLVALLQALRVYGQSIAQVADAEVRLFHLYVHEPLLREGGSGKDIAQEMRDLVQELLPLTTPIMERLHQRFLRYFVEQDVVAHMEADTKEFPTQLGRLRVAIAFADLAGYTRLTEEIGDEEAVGVVERFVETVAATLPADARIVKTIGDAVMVVGVDVQALATWAIQLQNLVKRRPLPRVGVHYGEVVFRDGDYFGREVNQAARVAAQAGAGEVLVTESIVAACAEELQFESIGLVKLKGIIDPIELFLARVG